VAGAMAVASVAGIWVLGRGSDAVRVGGTASNG
jgi:hypothetical protein